MINSLIPNYDEMGDLRGQALVGGIDTAKAEIYEVSRIVSSVFQNPKPRFFNVNTTSEILFYWNGYHSFIIDTLVTIIFSVYILRSFKRLRSRKENTSLSKE